MKEDGLKSYFSKIIQLDYRINPIYLRMADEISFISTIFCLEGSFILRVPDCEELVRVT